MNNIEYKTKQKQAILNFLKNNRDNHVTVNDISVYLENNNCHVGITTIYRYLDKLLEQGTVRKYTVDNSTSACFQYVDPSKTCHEHFHLKCEVCGKLIHLHCSHISELCSHIFNDHGFKPDMMRTVFYGICSVCSQKQENNGGNL